MSGLFIAAYRLIQDFYNSQLEDIDIFQTVMEMRDSGLSFMENQDQFRFIFQCLHDEVRSSEESAEPLNYPVVYLEEDL